MGRLRLAGIPALVALATGPIAHAQDASEPGITVRVAPSIATLEGSIVTRATARTHRPFEAGARLTEELDDPSRAPDLGPHVVGIAHHGARIALFATAPSGRRHVSELGAGADDTATTRAIVVGIALLLDDLDADVAPPPPEEPARVVEIDLPPLDGSALDDLAPPFAPLNFDPGFVMELRERIGYATQRDQGATASGLSLGVCFGTWWCLLFDADAMAPEEVHQLSVGDLRYLATTLGIGGRFLPLEAGPVRGGVGIDAIMRVGHMWTSRGFSATVTDPGVRFMAEMTVHFGGPVWLAIEGGADVSFLATRWIRDLQLIFTEDVMLLWGALGIRVGPF